MKLNLHKRAHIVDEARLEFRKFMLDLKQKHELTFGELFSMLGEKIADLAMYQVRAERHPDNPGKKGDEA